MTFRQYRVTIGGVLSTTDEHGKFVPITEETSPTQDKNHGNGNNAPQDHEQDGK